MLVDLTAPEWRFDGPSPTGIDHVLVRGLKAGAPSIWPRERRLLDGKVLSDHPPLEREVA
jgi:endonuclease/exonuclease/phosphatase family metal-dependent hydrolase